MEHDTNGVRGGLLVIRIFLAIVALAALSAMLAIVAGEVGIALLEAVGIVTGIVVAGIGVLCIVAFVLSLVEPWRSSRTPAVAEPAKAHRSATTDIVISALRDAKPASAPTAVPVQVIRTDRRRVAFWRLMKGRTQAERALLSRENDERRLSEDILRELRHQERDEKL